MQVHGRDLSGEEMGELLGQFCNAMGNAERDKAFINQVTRREHRTLQGSMLHLMLDTIQAWANLEDFAVDLRNEDVRSLAKEIVAAIGDKRPRFI